MISFLVGLGKRYWPAVLGYLAIAGAIAGILLGVRNAGKQAERMDQIKKELDNAKTRQRIEVRNNAKPGDTDAVRERVRAQRDKLRRSL